MNGFDAPVNVAVSGVPSGLTATPSSFTLTPGKSVTVAISAGGTATAGSYSLMMTGTSGSLEHDVSISAKVTVPAGFSLSVSPTSLTIRAGAASQFSLSAQAVNGWSEPINVAVTGLPSGVSVSPSAFSLAAGTPQKILVTSTSHAAVGNGGVTLTASATSLAHAIVMPLVIQPQLNLVA